MLTLLDQSSTAASPPGLLQYFLATGFVGPLLLLLGAAAALLVVRRWLELRPDRLAPENTQRLLEQAVRQRQLDQAYAQATANGTVLGELVAAGLLLRGDGLDEMLANCERASIKESLRREARLVAIARLGTTILLLALLGTVLGVMSTMSWVAAVKQPTVGDICEGLGESLASTAIGLFFALACHWLHGVLGARVVARLLAVRAIAEDLLAEAARPA